MEKNVSKVDPAALRKIIRAALLNAHDYIAKECEMYGISVAQLCRDAGVERSHFQRWKRKIPRSMSTFDKLLAQLDKAEAEFTGEEIPGANVATA